MELVFKFRDDIVLTPDLPAVKDLFELPPDYFAYAATYAAEAGLKPVELPTLLKEDPNMLAQWTSLLKELAELSSLWESRPTYLFRNAQPDAPLRLLRDALKPDMGSYTQLIQGDLPAKTVVSDRGTPYANLYNCFTIRLPDKMKAEDYLSLLSRLIALVPVSLPAGKERDYQRVRASLLGYIYLKDDPQPLSFPTALAASRTGGGNQWYLEAMQIETETDASRGRNVTLTVLEADSWYTAHRQFSGATYPLVFPLTPVGSGGFTLTNPGGNTSLATHGTAILGILQASGTDNDLNRRDLCRGIVPLATVRLASCMTQISLGSDPNHILTKPYDESSAVLQVVADSQTGDVVLIELGMGGQKYPLEVAPAVFEVLNLAFLKGVIVVEAAGNENLYIAERQSAERSVLTRAHIMAQLTINHGENQAAPTSNARFWNQYQATKQAIERAYAALGAEAADFPTIESFANQFYASHTNAILVGAAETIRPGASASVGILLAGSSWGNGVKVYAPGEKLLSTTYGNPAAPHQFTTIGHSSGAAAIIAGIVTSLQGRAKGQGFLLSPTQAAELLKTGRAVKRNGRATGGVIPNYKTAVATLQRWIKVHRRRPA